MRIKELIAKLSQYPQETEVMINERGGCPREINIGPLTRAITQGDADDGADCEGLVGVEVVIIGYGDY